MENCILPLIMYVALKILLIPFQKLCLLTIYLRGILPSLKPWYELNMFLENLGIKEKTYGRTLPSLC